MVLLTRDERDFLAQGVLQWGGPARPSHALAVAFKMESVDALADEGVRLCDKLRSAESLTDDEIVFALTSTEVNFASDRWGAGYEWETASGYSDADTIARLRKLQVKLVGVGTRPW